MNNHNLKFLSQKPFLADLVNHFGGVPGLAAVLGISRHAIYQWKKIPPARAFQIEVLTQGKFKGQDLLDCITTQTQEN